MLAQYRLHMIRKEKFSNRNLLIVSPILVVAVLLALSSFSSVYAQSQTTTPGIVYGGTVYVSGGGIGPWSDNFNPFSPTAVDPATIGLLYQTLIYWNNANGSLNPWLATGWTFNNATTLTMNIRQGVLWNDGVPFTAQDVAFTFNLLKKYPALDTYGVWSVLSSVTAPNNATVIFKFSKPATPYLFYIGYLVPIVPEHIWQNVSNPVTFNNPNPVATGPFKLYYFSPNEYILTKNTDYWIPGKPYVNYVVIVSAPSNTQAFLDLKSGQFSYVPMYAPSLNATWVQPDPEYHYYWFPPVAGYQYVLLNDQMYPLNLPQVRQAIAYAINNTPVDQIAESGYMPPVLSIGLNQYEWPSWVNSTVAQQYNYSYNPSMASSILKGLGFTMNSNGVLQTPNGTTLSFNYVVPSGFTDWVSAAQIIKNQLASIGIQINVVGTSVTQWVSDVQDGQFGFSMETVVNGPTPFYAYNSLLNSNLSAPIGQTATGDYERFYNSTVNQLLQQWFSSINSTQELQYASKIEAIFGQQMPVIPDVARVPFGIFNSTVFTGWPTPSNPYASSEPWQEEGMDVIFQSIHLRPQFASLANVAPSIPSSSVTTSSTMPPTSTTFYTTSPTSVTSATTSSTPPTSTTTTTTSNTALIAAVIVVIIIIIIAAALLLRRRK